MRGRKKCEKKSIRRVRQMEGAGPGNDIRVKDDLKRNKGSKH